MPRGGYQTPAALYAARILSDQAEPKPAPTAAKNIKTATGEAYTERGIQRNKKRGYNVAPFILMYNMDMITNYSIP